MRPRRHGLDPVKKAKVLEEIRRNRVERDATYREQALKLFPHICGRCGKEFSGKDLRELTVHHKDSNHFNNPPDGRNWELLCLYCHDAEHAAIDQRAHYDGPVMTNDEPALGFEAFSGLKDLLPPSDEPSATQSDEEPS